MSVAQAVECYVDHFHANKYSNKLLLPNKSVFCYLFFPDYYAEEFIM